MKFVSTLVSFLGTVNSFTPSVFLTGPVGSELIMQGVPRSIAYKYVKKCQLEELENDSPAHICKELDDAREMLRSSSRVEDNVSFLVSKTSESHLFTILYRMSDKFPKIYTVDAVVRQPDSYNSMSSCDLERMLHQMVKDRKGHLQVHPLRTWSDGRYFKESRLERQFEMETLD